MKQKFKKTLVRYVAFNFEEVVLLKQFYQLAQFFGIFHLLGDYTMAFGLFYFINLFLTKPFYWHLAVQ